MFQSVTTKNATTYEAMILGFIKVWYFLKAK